MFSPFIKCQFCLVTNGYGSVVLSETVLLVEVRLILELLVVFGWVFGELVNVPWGFENGVSGIDGILLICFHFGF